MSDLIKRLKARSTQLQIVGKYHADIDEAITALSPALPDDVAELIGELEGFGLDGSELTQRAADMLERHQRAIRQLQNVNLANSDLIESQAREIRKLKRRPSIASFNALQEECDGRMVAIKKLTQRTEELEDD